MRATRIVFVGAALFLLSCEDGPEQVFTPLGSGPSDPQNGFASGAPWVQDGSKDYSGSSGGDSEGRARFCDEGELRSLVERMVVAPIVPDTSVGMVPLWAADGKPVRADDLLGRPEDDKFCDA